MNEGLSSLPRYPKEAGSELPPRRCNWIDLLEAGFAVVAVVGLSTCLCLLAPAMILVAVVPGFLFVAIGMLAVFGTMLLGIFIYAWQRSEWQDW